MSPKSPYGGFPPADEGSQVVAGELVVIRSADEEHHCRAAVAAGPSMVSASSPHCCSSWRQGTAIDQLAFRKSVEAGAPASVKALANDPACYARYSARTGGQGLPASEAPIVAYLEDCQARKLKPASVNRRIASLAVAHGLLGVPSPTRAVVVRDAMHRFRRRVDVTQRQAGPLRFSEGIGIEPAKGFTLSKLLQACDTGLPGLRDAALVSLAYDTRFRVSEFVQVAVEHIAAEADDSAMLTVPNSKTDQEGQGGLCLALARHHAADNGLA